MLSIIKGPYLQWPTQTSMTILWETSSEATGEVTWWAAERVHATGTGHFPIIEGSEQTVLETGNEPRCIHQVTLTGLDPETLYYYHVRSTDGQRQVCESDRHPLKTAVNDATPFSFAVTSETGGTCRNGITDNRRRESRCRYRRDKSRRITGPGSDQHRLDWRR